MNEKDFSSQEMSESECNIDLLFNSGDSFQSDPQEIKNKLISNNIRRISQLLEMEAVDLEVCGISIEDASVLISRARYHSKREKGGIVFRSQETKRSLHK